MRFLSYVFVFVIGSGSERNHSLSKILVVSLSKLHPEALSCMTGGQDEEVELTLQTYIAIWKVNQ